MGKSLRKIKNPKAKILLEWEYSKEDQSAHWIKILRKKKKIWTIFLIIS